MSVKTRKVLRNSRSKWYHDRGAKDLKELNEGDTVRIKPSILGKKKWDFGKIVEKLENRSYVVESNESLLRRNRVHLKKTNEVERPEIVKSDNDVKVCPSETVMRPNQDKGLIDDSNSPVNSDANSQKTVKPVNKDYEVKLKVPDREVRSTRNKLPKRYNDFVVNK